VQLCKTPYEVANGADALLLATEWNEFKQLDFSRIRELMRSPVLMDSRNLWDPEQVRALGFTYFSIGRGKLQNGH
jgi:UDPglucose 6-dehydrogenase